MKPLTPLTIGLRLEPFDGSATVLDTLLRISCASARLRIHRPASSCPFKV